MNRNTITLIIALLLGGLTFWLISRSGSGTIKSELKDFAVSDTGSVTKIFLIDKSNNKVLLTKEADGKWKVNGDYYARPDAVKTLLRTMHDVSVREPVGLKARENIIKQLATGAIKCEIYIGDKLVRQYYVGSETAEATGTYMLLSDVSDPDDIQNSTEPFVMEIKGFNGYLTTRYSTNASEWRDRTAFRYFVPDIHTITVKHRDEQAENSFIIEQAPGKNVFSLKTLSGKPLPFDTIAVKQFVSYFGHIGFENFANELPKPFIDSILATPPVHTITVTDASNKKNEIKMYLRKNNGFDPDDTTAAKPPFYDPDRMYAQLPSGDFVLIQYYVFGKLLQTPEYFMPRKGRPVDMPRPVNKP